MVSVKLTGMLTRHVGTERPTENFLTTQRQSCHLITTKVLLQQVSPSTLATPASDAVALTVMCPWHLTHCLEYRACSITSFLIFIYLLIDF